MARGADAVETQLVETDARHAAAVGVTWAVATGTTEPGGRAHARCPGRACGRDLDTPATDANPTSCPTHCEGTATGPTATPHPPTPTRRTPLRRRELPHGMPLATIQRLHADGFAASLDLLGESVTDGDGIVGASPTP